MHHKMDTIVSTLKQDLPRFLDQESVEQACREAGHRWRRRVLTPVEILHLVSDPGLVRKHRG